MSDDTTLNKMPFAECPHCHHEYQVDDYWDYKEGDTLDCPKCGTDSVVTSRDTVIWLTLKAQPHKDETPNCQKTAIAPPEPA